MEKVDMDFEIVFCKTKNTPILKFHFPQTEVVPMSSFLFSPASPFSDLFLPLSDTALCADHHYGVPVAFSFSSTRVSRIFTHKEGM